MLRLCEALKEITEFGLLSRIQAGDSPILISGLYLSAKPISPPQSTD